MTPTPAGSIGSTESSALLGLTLRGTGVQKNGRIIAVRELAEAYGAEARVVQTKAG
jgi:hypothetical protein